ncbi:MAG: S8 family serine peptidase [Actinomycetota bacterium]|nr:S8 family serine peptidase [Actinomycetota bacterium]
MARAVGATTTPGSALARHVAGIAAAALALSALGASPAAAGAASGNESSVKVIVQADPGASAAARAAVSAVGGTISMRLPIVNGFAARLPRSAVAEVATAAGIRAVTPDVSGSFSEGRVGDESIDADALATTYPRSANATAAWERGITGAGVTVAVLDSGITEVPDLAGRVAPGIDLSGEQSSRTDSYGHGTVMAGIVAGAGTAENDADEDGARYVGVAPGARVLPVKVSARNGAADVSAVLYAMQWIASAKERTGIRVLSLSWGTRSTAAPSVDPLNYAVQRLWERGIVVVASAGNTGPEAGTVTTPGNDPVVVTVGAYNEVGDTLAGNDRVPAWSGRGNAAAGLAKPDIVAPGRTIVAPLAPGSAVVEQHPEALVGTRYVKGSGTSQATALTAGAVALLLEAHPGWTPDQVKHALRAAARPISATAADAQGAGRLDIRAALRADVTGAAVQPLTAKGTGTLDGSRAGRLVEATCEDGSRRTITGEIDALCRPWTADSWSADSWSADSWSADSWSADSWSADSWSADSWSGQAWSADSWSADSWSADSWSADSWSADSWSTVFWGKQPNWRQKVAGEPSAARPVRR